MCTDSSTLDSLSNFNILNEDINVDKEFEGLTCLVISLKKKNKEERVELKNVTYQVGPFSVSHPMKEDDLKLIQYVFDPNLDPRFDIIS